jgi:hypothetical protein
MAETKKTGLYICFPCSTIDEIPDYKPEEADRDPRIGFLVSNHLNRHPSFETRTLTDWCSLGSVETSHWENPKEQQQIKEKILENHGLTGFDAEFYATQNTFKEDAMKCFQAHHRPSYTEVGCQDYLSGSKEIKPDTALERKVADMPRYDDVKIRKSFLCEYCPYHSQVLSIERMKRG